LLLSLVAAARPRPDQDRRRQPDQDPQRPSGDEGPQRIDEDRADGRRERGQGAGRQDQDDQDQRDQLKPDAPQWADLNKQFVQARTEAQTWQQTTQQELARKFRDQAVRMNEKITKEIAEVAKAKGFDMVLAEQTPELNNEQLASMQPQQVMGVLFGSRNVLFAAGTTDLTQDVITKLDAGYKSPAGAAAPTPAPAAK
jgi:Skp family chaperone for outer membrane proteins